MVNTLIVTIPVIASHRLLVNVDGHEKTPSHQWSYSERELNQQQYLDSDSEISHLRDPILTFDSDSDKVGINSQISILRYCLSAPDA